VAACPSHVDSQRVLDYVPRYVFPIQAHVYTCSSITPRRSLLRALVVVCSLRAGHTRRGHSPRSPSISPLFIPLVRTSPSPLTTWVPQVSQPISSPHTLTFLSHILTQPVTSLNRFHHGSLQSRQVLGQVRRRQYVTSLLKRYTLTPNPQQATTCPSPRPPSRRSSARSCPPPPAFPSLRRLGTC
jgi:hypothetical protein